jgi:hypothetical protein
MNVETTSPDGKLRMRLTGRRTAVVELKGTDDRWTWCVWQSSPLERARELFLTQLKFHEGDKR